MLQLQSFEKAIFSLKMALQEYDKESNDFIRDSCIQRFEYTYELSWKMLKRYLQMNSANPASYNEISFQNLIREGKQKDILLNDWSKWKIYRNARCATSHTYDNHKANEVFQAIPLFLKEAEFLYNKLLQCN